MVNVPILHWGHQPSAPATREIDQAPPILSQLQTTPAMQEASEARGRRSSTRASTFFSHISRGRPILPSQTQRGARVQPGHRDEDVESPKTPRYVIGFPALPSTRLDLPYLTRTWTNDSGDAASHPSTTPTTGLEGAPQPSSPGFTSGREAHSPQMAAPREPTDPHAVVVEPRALAHIRARFPISDHDDDANQGRASSPAFQPNLTADPRPSTRRFMLCLPWIQSRRVRSQILRCFSSGMLLILLLAVYLALSITKNIKNSELTVLLILIILFTTIFFCHGLVRLCFLVLRPRPESEQARSAMTNMFGPGGYAIPRRPIRVVLARDEEVAGLESQATITKPPAYGVWRESVRVDPNRLFWQRNHDAPRVESSPSAQSRNGSRPPSYSSEDGVAYVIDAAPRSTVPMPDIPLPTHPSEAGRWNGQWAPSR